MSEISMSLPPLHQINMTKQQMEQSKISAPVSTTYTEPQEGAREGSLDEWIAERDEYFYKYCGNKPMSKSTQYKYGGILIYEERMLRPGEEDTFQDYDKVFDNGDGNFKIYIKMRENYQVHEVRSALADHSQTYFENAAQRYLKEGREEYLDSFLGKAVNGIGEFSGKIHNFFGVPYEENKDMTEQIKNVIRELAKQIEAGNGERLDTLKSKIQIGDVDFSANDLIKTIKAIDDITKPLGKPGHLNIEDSILYGVSVSQMNNFASLNLNDEQAKLLTGAYTKRVQNAMAQQEKISSQLAAKNGINSKDYEGNFSAFHLTSKGTASGMVFDLFASLDASSSSSFQQSFSNALSKFDSFMLQLRNSNQPTDGYREMVNKAFGSLQITANGTNRTSFFSRHDDPKYDSMRANLKKHIANGTQPTHYLRPLRK